MSVDRDKDSIQEIELGEHTKHDGDHENVQISENYIKDTHQMLNNNQNQKSFKIKQHLILFSILLVILLGVIIGLLYFYFFYQNPKNKFYYKGNLVEECPENTYLFDNTVCLEQCQENQYYRGKQCVKNCEKQDYQMDNYCIISDCNANIDDQNKQRIRNLVSKRNLAIQSFYDFSSKQCVSSCSSTQFQLFGEFCVEQNCPKKEIYTVVSQYASKRQNNTISIKSYDNLSLQFQNLIEEELIIIKNQSNKVCNLGCEHSDKKYVTFNKSTGEYECIDSCPDKSLVYIKAGQSLCYNECPPNTYLSVSKNECVNSCGNLFISNDKCVSSCNQNELIEGNKCVDVCSQDKPYTYNSRYCVSSCLIDLKTPFALDKECVVACPANSFLYPIKGQQNAFECAKSCDLLSSNDRICADFCEDSQVEVVENKQRKCFKKMRCTDNNTFYVPEEGCKINCSTKYPIMFFQQCIPKCFENFFQHLDQCLPFCPSAAPYSYNGQCVKNCNNGLFYYRSQCYSTCPDNLFKNMSNYSCVKQCSSFYVLSDHSCYSKCPPSNPYNLQNECLVNCPETKFIYNDPQNNSNCVDRCPKQMYLAPDKKCVSECPSNLFIDKEMKMCVEKCHSTYDSKNICKPRCDTNQRYIFGSENCLEKCPQDFFQEENSNECIGKCDNLYYKAKDGENKCTPNCQSIQAYLLNDQCVFECPKFFYNNICIEECPRQTPYSENKQCVSSCSLQKILYQQKCIDKCPDKLYYILETRECLSDCPKGQLIYEEEQKCKQGCQKLTFDNKYCVDQCPSFSVNKNNLCQSYNQNVPGFYLNENGEIINNCDFNDGYYTDKRVCKKCKGGEGCKQCSLLYGLCIECKKSFSLYNDECIKSCPTGYIDKTGICIKDNKFLKENLFFREYGDSRYLNVNQTMKFSVLQDNTYIKSLGDDIKTFNDESNKYQFSVIVHLHDLNSTYLDLYQYTLNYGSNEEQQQQIDNLKLAVIDQGISIITVQATEILFFDKQFDLIIHELLPSIGYFKCNIIFTGIGTASNSILKSVSQLLNTQYENASRHIFGNYLIDLQLNFGYEQMTKELTKEQQNEFKKFVQTEQDFVENNLDITCSLLDQYLQLTDVTYTNQSSKSEYKSMNDVFSHQISMSKCRDKHVKPEGMIVDFKRDKENTQSTKPQFNNDEYISEKRKMLVYQYISQNMLQDISEWLNNSILE